jgi:hypothetical protein
MGGEMAKAAQNVPVSKRALIARIARKLQAQDDPERLMAARSPSQRKKLGAWFVLDCMGHVVYEDLDLEKFGRKIGVLRDFEAMEDPDA